MAFRSISVPPDPAIVQLKSKTERRLFQAVVYVTALVPISAGAAGMVEGPAMIHRQLAVGTDLDSHFRYLSGLLLGIGLAFVFAAATLPKGAQLFRVLGLIVILGGLGRLLGATMTGFPGGAHRFALVMELLVMPGLVLWLGRIERFHAANPGMSPR